MEVTALRNVALQQFAATATRVAAGAERVATPGARALLADAGQGAAELRVVVGGGGPAGLATASLLRRAGADVLVVFPRQADARRGSVMVQQRAWDVLERAGGHHAARMAPLDDTGTFRMASIRSIEEELEGAARRVGVHVDDAHQVDDVVSTGDGVRVRVSDPRFPDDVQTVDADWYVDASGGNSPLARSDAFRRELVVGSFGALPAQRTIIAQAAEAIPGRSLGWTAPDGAFAINDVDEGLVTAYRGLDEVDTAHRVDAAEAVELLRALDIDPATRVGEPWAFTATQQLAKSAGQGRILIVGDGAGTVLPVTQSGVMLALLDAERAAKTITTARGASAEAVQAAVAEYDAQTRAMHHLFHA